MFGPRLKAHFFQMQEAKHFSLVYSVQTISEANPASNLIGTRVFSHVIELLAHAADHSPPCSIAVKNCRATPPLP